MGGHTYSQKQSKTVVGSSPSNSIATKHGSKMPGLGKHKTGSGGKSKSAGNAHGPFGKKM